jgi:hypothetical protein
MDLIQGAQKHSLADLYIYRWAAQQNPYHGMIWCQSTRKEREKAVTKNARRLQCSMGRCCTGHGCWMRADSVQGTFSWLEQSESSPQQCLVMLLSHRSREGSRG